MTHVASTLLALAVVAALLVVSPPTIRRALGLMLLGAGVILVALWLP